MVDNDLNIPNQIRTFFELFVLFPGCQKDNDQSGDADKLCDADEGEDFYCFHGGAVGWQKDYIITCGVFVYLIFYAKYV